jgi:phage shock protein PspC (stress-responsive transcriptional regulator)
MTETLTYKQLRRSRSDRMIAGVSGGLGRYFDVNPVFYRVGFVVLALLGGAGILIYAAAALVIPDEGRDESIVEQALRERRSRPWRLIGLALVTVSAIVLVSEAHVWNGQVGWVLVLIAGVVLLALGPRLWSEVTTPAAAGAEPAPGDGGQVPTPPPARSFSLAMVVLGLLVVGAGILGLLAASGVDLPWAVVFAVGAGAVGAAVVAGAFLHQRVGWLVVLGMLLGAIAILISTISLRLGDGVGDRTYAPRTVDALKAHYRLGIGNLEVDLSKLELPAGTTRVDADLGIGHLRVIVPPDVSVRVHGHADYGELDLPGGVGGNGRGVSSDYGPSTGARLVIDADVGAGQVEVERAVR